MAGRRRSDYQALTVFADAAGRVLVIAVGPSRRAGRQGLAHGRGRRPHAGRAVLPGCAPELRREPPAAHRRSAGARLQRREPCPSLDHAPASCGARWRRFAAALRRDGVQAGDRVAAFIPNIPEAIVAALGCAAVGAVWSSCSPDFGVQGVLDRFGQIEPRLLITADGYFYAGKTHDTWRASHRCSGLPTVERTIVVPFVGVGTGSGGLPNAVTLARLSGRRQRRAPVRSAAVRSSALHPVLVGHHRRAQVHRARRRRHADSAPEGASAPLRHQAGRSRLLLHDLRLDDVELAGLGAGVRRDAACSTTDRRSIPTATSCSTWPIRPESRCLAPRPKFIDAVQKASLVAARGHIASTTVRTIASTGLAARTGELRLRLRARQARRPPRVDLGRHRHRRLLCAGQSRRSGVARRDSGRGLGMAVEVFDESGQPIRGEKGELVCTKPFPSMPIGFWNDPDGRKIPRRRISRLSRRVAARRLRGDHRARRRDHLRPIRRDPEPWRRPHRHRRDLPPGRADRRRRREPGGRPAASTTTNGSCCSSGCATA